MPSFIARAEYVGNGIQTAYPSGIFAYLDVNHIKVYVDGALQLPGTDYTFNEGNVTVTFNSPPADGSDILIVRETSRGTALVNFGTGSQPVSRSSLNLAVLQNMYISQEAFDASESTRAASSAELLDRVNEAGASAQAALTASQAAQAAATAAQTSALQAQVDVSVVQGTSLDLINDIQQLTERVTILEGGAVNSPAPAPVPTPAPAPTPPPAPASFNVLVIGDSVTVGNEPSYYSYRGPMGARVAAAEHTVDYIGPNSSPSTGFADPDHAGYNSATMGPDSTGNNIFSRLATILATGTPDIVVLYIGINDTFTAAVSADNIATKFTGLFNQLLGDLPNAEFVLAIPNKANWLSAGELTKHEQLRTAIIAAADGSARARVADVDSIISVAGGSTDIAGDGLHLSQSGAVKAGDLIGDKIIEIIEGVAPPASSTVYEFNGALPPGATVQRAANTNATSITSVGQLVRHPNANTPRWDYNPGGTLKGLMLEREETNELVNPVSLSGGAWTLLGGATLTTNGSETDPTGTAGVRVLTIPAGVAAGAGGLRYGIAVANNVNIFRRVWLRSLTGSSVLLRLRTSDGSTIDNVVTVGTGWTAFDVEGVISLGYINFDIINNDTAGVTVGVAFPMLIEGAVGSDPTTLALDGQATRPGETLTLAVPNGTYSLTVEGPNGVTFNVPSITVSGGSYVLNPATINLPFRRVRKVTFGAEGSVPAPPPAPPPPSSTGVTRQLIVDDMGLGNDGGALPGAPTNNSWHLRAFITKGGDARGSFYPTYWNGGDWVNRFWNRLAQWFVIWPINGHPEFDINVRVRIRSHEMWLLREGASAWELLAASNGAWVEAFNNNLIDPTIGQAPDMRVESVGRSFRQRFGLGWHHHGGSDAGFPQVSDPDSVRGVMARFRAVLIPHDPNGPNQFAQARYALSSGCDWYPRDTTDVRSFPSRYIPASSASRFKLVTTVEQPFTTLNINVPNVAIDGPMSFSSDRRILTLDQFNTVPLPEFTL